MCELSVDILSSPQGASTLTNLIMQSFIIQLVFTVACSAVWFVSGYLIGQMREKSNGFYRKHYDAAMKGWADAIRIASNSTPTPQPPKVKRTDDALQI